MICQILSRISGCNAEKHLNVVSGCVVLVGCCGILADGCERLGAPNNWFHGFPIVGGLDSGRLDSTRALFHI